MADKRGSGVNRWWLKGWAVRGRGETHKKTKIGHETGSQVPTVQIFDEYWRRSRCLNASSRTSPKSSWIPVPISWNPGPHPTTVLVSIIERALSAVEICVQEPPGIPCPSQGGLPRKDVPKSHGHGSQRHSACAKQAALNKGWVRASRPVRRGRRF